MFDSLNSFSLDNLPPHPMGVGGVYSAAGEGVRVRAGARLLFMPVSVCV